MPTQIKCPHCAGSVSVEDVLTADAEQKIKQQYEKQLQQNLQLLTSEKKKLEDEQRKFEEKKRNENELFQQKLQQEKARLEGEMQQQKIKLQTCGIFPCASTPVPMWPMPC